MTAPLPLPPPAVLAELRRRAQNAPAPRFVDPDQMARVERAWRSHPDWVREVIGRSPGPSLVSRVAMRTGRGGARLAGLPSLTDAEATMVDLALTHVEALAS